MDADLLKILSEELREIRIMSAETKRLADAAQKTADAAQKTADAAQKTADAAQKTADAAMKQANACWSKAESAWELVIMTRNQVQEDLRKVKLPWWRKLLDAA